ncbi:hypothetical protein F406_gp076 [Agrobacterium phage 7-7-1]|uniref:Uncharacterized protein n=1 Tax=Agrobacterium phage 7-7-1 TaxID=1161931 RepID=J7FA63_9CAUD|nr:hypothetical protein F406_gp076 [Agrobacterium phage 7-7-1]AFH19739.1 hypothetical protein 7-7-1_00041 [Agrobacterium phage 7-7-1]
MRLIGSTYGLAAAILVSAMLEPSQKIGMAREYGELRRSKHPNHNGPVIDTTKESKRAKRRRMAKGK